MFKALVGFALWPGRLKTRFLPLEVEALTVDADVEADVDFDRDAVDDVGGVVVLALPDFFGDVFVGLEPFLFRRDLLRI